MKIAIIGYGKQGASAYRYWSNNNDLVIHDLDPNTILPPGARSVLGEHYLENLGDYDLIVRSPGVHPNDIIAANNPAILEKVTTPTNEFFKVNPTKNIIGVTGTKGKGTTSSLITEILKTCGFKAILGGNFGTSPLDMLEAGISEADWVVLELANFQLIDFKYSAPIAVCLMVAEEHLNWHADRAEYISSKKQLFINQKPEDIAVYYANNPNSVEVISVSKGKKIPYFVEPGAVVQDNHFVIDGQVICNVDEIKLSGHHNWENICAAITTVWQISKDAKALKKAIVNFSGLEHRLEPVRALNDVQFYDDSYGTAPYSVMAAIDAIKGDKILIIGGSDKGSDLSDMVKKISSSSGVFVLLIGASAERVKTELDKIGFKNYEITSSKSIFDIVVRAKEIAKPGQSVILAPGFASFDMFKNYEERGRLYKQAVNQL